MQLRGVYSRSKLAGTGGATHVPLAQSPDWQSRGVKQAAPLGRPGVRVGDGVTVGVGVSEAGDGAIEGEGRGDMAIPAPLQLTPASLVVYDVSEKVPATAVIPSAEHATESKPNAGELRVAHERPESELVYRALELTVTAISRVPSAEAAAAPQKILFPVGGNSVMFGAHV